MAYTKGARLTLPRPPRPVVLPFDLVGGRLVRLNAPYKMLVEMRAEWDEATNEDRGWIAERLSEITDDDLIAGFAEHRAANARG